MQACCARSAWQPAAACCCEATRRTYATSRCVPLSTRLHWAALYVTAISAQFCGRDVLCTAAADGSVVLQRLDMVRQPSGSWLVLHAGPLLSSICQQGDGERASSCALSSHLLLAVRLPKVHLFDTRPWCCALLTRSTGVSQTLLQLYRLVRCHDSRRGVARGCSGSQVWRGVWQLT